jgi:hypothetical protein
MNGIKYPSPYIENITRRASLNERGQPQRNLEGAANDEREE